ncbi:MAG: SoxR reducing system RseC family protein [Oscillospiraceae bacterium]|nr:SoxR reducing system RseC family protein [Oscillospiraceae bacterium]
MTQDAVVTKLMPRGMAEVTVVRSTACGGSCGSCESCIYQNELKTLARNKIDAQPGQKVVIESKTSVVVGAAMLVYIMPLALFLIGYALAAAAGASEGLCIAVSFAALVVGAVILVTSQKLRKNKNPITFDIVGFV